MEGAQQACDTVEVVSMEMSDEDGMNPAPLHARPHQLQLRPFAAVEQEDVALAYQGRRRQASSECRDGGTGSKKHYFHRYLNIPLKT